MNSSRLPTTGANAMNIQSLSGQSPVELAADAIVIGVYKDQPLSGASAQIDQALDGKLTQLIDADEISTCVGSTHILFHSFDHPCPIFCIVGLGESETSNASLAFQAAGAAAKALASKERDTIAYFLEFPNLHDAVCGSMVGCVGQDLYREKKKLNPPANIIWVTEDSDAVTRGEILGRAVNFTRYLVNEPAGALFPESFANHCESMGKKSGLAVEIWDQKRLEKENCGALLGVARGSDQPPRLVVMNHSGGDPNQAPLMLVGKGVTFDSGGLSLKPSESMLEMKCDMAGAATVVGAMQAIAELNLPVNVTGIIGCVENMVSGSSYKLGDVLKAKNGKTIEIHNTDAEGRLVLADALSVAVERGAGRIVDLATLTGACVVALGRFHAGLMTNNEDFCSLVKGAAKTCGELAWELPMDDMFGEFIKSNVADIKNVGDGRWGGAMTAAKLLEEFVDGIPWTHIDIAGPSFGDDSQAWIDGGATGCFVRTLVELARTYS